MGRSLGVEVVYGWRILDPEGAQYELPWVDEDDPDRDLEGWWLDRSGFDLPSPYAENGNDLRPGVSEADKVAWWDRRHQWLRDHPCPIEVVDGGTEGYSPPLVIRPVGDEFSTHLDGWEASPLPARTEAFVAGEVGRIRGALALIEELDLPVDRGFGVFVVAWYR